MNITYRNTNQSITSLIEKAEQGKNVIPSIQRPFVWGPEKVAKFIDSLLRGWPFGTMLFMQDSGLELFHSHPFDVEGIDKIDDSNHEEIVLDGQQRYQSILIAFSKKSHGYTLSSSEWKEVGCSCSEKNNKITKYLCFNLSAWFADGIPTIHSDVESENEAWLTWKTAGEIEKCGNYIRLSDIFWNTQSNSFKSHALDYLIKQISIMRGNEIPVLKIQAENIGTASSEEMEEAVVDIFTRLNTQGTPLTHEQILSASITQTWEDFPNKLQVLQEELRDKERYAMKTISNDDLVAGFNLILKVETGEKNIRQAYNLMKSFPEQWETSWKRFSNLTLALINELKNNRSIRYTKEYKSLHSLWFVIALMYKFDIDEKNISTDEKLIQGIIRWLMVTAWAKTWAHSSKTNVDHLTSNLLQCSSEGRVHALLDEWLFEKMGKKCLAQRACDGIYELQASARNSVRTYYTPLLVWMRLEEQRAKLLTYFEFEQKDWDVDHIIPAAWNDDKRHELNAIGNCWLLNHDANIKKSDDSFADFCNAYKIKCNEVSGPILAARIAQFNKIDCKNGKDRVLQEINQREKQIKDSIVDYIKCSEPKLFFSTSDTHSGYNFDVNDIYLGKEYTENLPFKGYSLSTKRDYFLGVKNAIATLQWNKYAGPCKEGSSADDVISYIEKNTIESLVKQANLQNQNYEQGFKNYLKFIIKGHRKGTSIQINTSNLKCTQNTTRGSAGDNHAAIIASAIISGCTSYACKERELVIDSLVKKHADFINKANSINSALSQLRKENVFVSTKELNQKYIRFSHAYWDKLSEIIKELDIVIPENRFGWIRSRLGNMEYKNYIN